MEPIKVNDFEIRVLITDTGILVIATDDTGYSIELPRLSDDKATVLAMRLAAAAKEIGPRL